MSRVVILWSIVALGVGGAVATRIVRQRAAERQSHLPASRPTATTLPTPHDYVTSPIVDPAERDRGPRSIISMAPSITETCCALGLLDHLSGRTRYCTLPPAVTRVPDIGALVDANLELISTIRPDVILISQNAVRMRDQLTPLKIPFESVTDDSFEGIFLAVRRVGEICNRPRTASRLIENLQDELAAISSAAQTRRSRRVLIVLGELPVPPQSLFVAGPNLFLSRLLSRLGHLNAAESVIPGKSGELSLEQIVTLNPDVILETRPTQTPQQMDTLYAAWAKIGRIRAFEDRAVRSYGDKTNLVPSPRINVVYHELAVALEDWR